MVRLKDLEQYSSYEIKMGILNPSTEVNGPYMILMFFTSS